MGLKEIWFQISLRKMSPAALYEQRNIYDENIRNLIAEMKKWRIKRAMVDAELDKRTTSRSGSSSQSCGSRNHRVGEVFAGMVDRLKTRIKAWNRKHNYDSLCTILLCLYLIGGMIVMLDWWEYARW